MSRCEDQNQKQLCEGGVLESTNLNEAFVTSAIPATPVRMKVPLVLAEFTVRINVEASIQLNEPAFEIKRIIKNIFLTQCRLVGTSGQIFLRGFIRKNIEYATATDACSTGSGISGSINYTTVDVPFHTTAPVPFVFHPALTANPTTNQFEYLNDCICTNPLEGRDVTQTDFTHSEIFNEKVFCELIRADIFEADIETDATEVADFPAERTFQNITEKLILNLTIKLLQNRQLTATTIL